MATFLTDMIRKGYTQDKVFAVLFESEQEKKRIRMQASVTETVNAHRLKKMKEFLAYEKLATWRRMNGFHRIVEGEENWFHGHSSLPLTHEQYAASVRSDLQKLKDAVSMPAEDIVTRPWQKTIDFVNGLKRKLPDEELAVIKRYVEKRSREAAQAQVTVTQVDTVQHSSPCPLDPEPSSSVYVKLENTEGKMGSELEEPESPSAGTGLEAPGQQCPPNEGIWETGRTIASGILTTGVESNQEGNLFSSTTESVDTRASEKSTRIMADTIFLQQGHKPRSEENKQFDPGEKGKKAPHWNAAVTLLFFLGRAGRLLACFLSVLCLCFSVWSAFLNYFSFFS